MNTLLQKNTFRGRGSGRSILVVVALILINLLSIVEVKAQTGYTKLPYTNTQWNSFPAGWTALGYTTPSVDVGPAGTSPSSLLLTSAGPNGSNLVIRYDQVPGPITFWARVSNASSFNVGEFIIEESVDGNNFTPLENIKDLSSEGNKYNATPSSTTRFIRFRYAKQATDANADVALDNVSVTGVGISVYQEEVFYPTGTSTYNFEGTHEVGSTSEPVSFTISNFGPNAVNITGEVTIEGSYAEDFKIESQPTSPIMVDDSKSFTVIFAPRNASPTNKNYNTYISIPNDDPNKSPYIINLSGTAVNTQELAINSFSPWWGPVGTTITIDGTGFTNGAGVTFSGNNGPITVPLSKWISSSQVQVVVPQNANTGEFTITDENRTATSPSAFYVSSEEPLPVEFLTFEGASTSRGVQLKWKTASETNNEYFQLESATTFKPEAFKPVMQVPSKVNNSNVVVSYEALDTRPAVASTIYYRIKQVDFDGKFEYSKVIAVTNKATSAAEFKVKPNPVVENKMVVELPDATGGDLALTFTSMTGARALQQTTSVEANMHEKEVSLDSLAPGMYIVTIEYNDQVSHQRVLKK